MTFRDARAAFRRHRPGKRLVSWLCFLTAAGALAGGIAGPPPGVATSSVPVLDIGGCMLWLRADQGVTQSNNAVSAWADQSGNGFTATQATAAQKPSFSAGGLNGQDAILFTGDYLTFSAGLLGWQTTFIVYKDISTAGYVTPLGADWTGNGGVFHGAANDTQIFDATYTADITRNGAHYRNGTALAWTAMPRPDNWSIDVHVATAPQGNAAYPLLYLGCDDYLPGSRAINGGIAEVILYSRALTPAELKRIGWYLQQRYGLAGSYVDPALPTVRNAGASGVSADAATLAAQLTGTGDPAVSTTLWLHWGDEDSGTNAWDNTVAFGTQTVGTVSTVVSNLSPSKTYYYRVQARSDAGAVWSEPLAFSCAPRSVAALALWLDAADLASLTATNGLVSQWNDKSGNARNFIRRAAGTEPETGLAACRGANVLAFTDEVDGMGRAGVLAAGDDTYTYLAVAYPTAAGTICGQGVNGGVSQMADLRWAPSLAYHIGWNNDAATPASSVAANAWHLFDLQVSNATSPNIAMRIDAAAYALTSPNPANLNVSAANSAVGCRGDNTANDRFGGQIAEVMVFSDTLSLDQRRTLGYYLQQKYGLAAGYADPALPEVATLGPQDITDSAATLRGSLTSIGVPAAATRVWVYWGRSDGGTGSWDRVESLGTNAVGPVSAAISGLSADTAYYYRFAASNSAGRVWAVRSMSFVASALQAIPGCRLWLRADNAAPGSVSTWRDMSGNGNDVSQATAAAMPVRDPAPAGFNGHRALAFDGGDWLSRASGMPSGAAGSYTKIAVFRYGATGVNNILGSEVNAAGAHTLFMNSTAYPQLYHQPTSFLTSTAPLAPNTVAILVGTYDAAINEGRLYLNGPAAGSAVAAADNSQAGIQIGAYAGGNPLTAGSAVAEVLVYDHVLSTVERNQVGVYLQAKYAIAGTYTVNPTVSAQDPTGVGTVAATANGTLVDDGVSNLATRVFLYWGPRDGGTTPVPPGLGAWAHVEDLGAQAEGARFSFAISGLASNAAYVYRFAATNSAGPGWSAAKVFTTYTPFNASSIPGCMLWLDGADPDADGIAEGTGETNVTGTAVMWADKSGGGRNFVQAAAARQPVYRPAGFSNGAGAFDFTGNTATDANGDCLTYPGTGPIPPGDDDYTYVVVWNADLHNQYRYVYSQGDGAGNSERACLILSNTSYGFNGLSNDANGFVPSAAEQNNLTMMLVDNNGRFGVSGGPNLRVYDEGVLFTATTGNPANLNVQQGLSVVGSSLGTAEFFDGRIAEILVYDRVLSATEMNQLGWYLGHKYAIAGPYTDPQLPEIRLLPATAVSADGARLNGRLVSRGIPATETRVSVHWGPEDAGDNSGPVPWAFSTLLGEKEVGDVFADVAGLAPDASCYYRFSASNGGGVAWSATGLVVPGDLPAMGGLSLWLRADSGVVTNAGAVTNWLDASGNLHHAGQATASRQPAWQDGVLAGRPVLRFDNADDGMTTPLNLAAPYTAFVIFSRSSAAPEARRALQGSSNWLIGPYQNYIAHYANGWVSQTAQPLVTNRFYIAAAANSGSASAFLVDGADRTQTAGIFGAPGTLSVGAGGAAPAEPLGGDLAEVIVFSRVLSAEEQNRVGYDLQQKYALAGEYQDPALPLVETLKPSNFGQGIGTFNGTLLSEGLPPTPTYVRLFWGTADASNNAGTVKWAYTNDLGVRAAGPLATNLTGLAVGTRYYYRFAASNEAAAGWVFSPRAQTYWFSELGNMDGLMLWLKADAGVSTNAAGEVTEWLDNSPAGNHARLFDGQTLPAYVPADPAIGQMPAVRFTNDRLQFPTVSGWTAFFVARVSAGGVNQGLLGYYNGGTTEIGIRLAEGARWRDGTSGGGDDFILPGGGTFRVNGTVGGLFTDGQWHIGEAARTAAGKRSFWAIGGYYPGRNMGNATVAEAIIYDRVLAADELQRIGSYLENRYGLDTVYDDPLVPKIVTLPAEAVGATNATLVGRLDSIGNAPALVWVYWGTSNGYGRVDGWQTNQFLGEYASAPESLSWSATGLAPSQNYFYRFRAANAYGAVWSTEPAASFYTDTRPAVRTDPPGIVTSVRAEARGELLSAGAAPTTVMVCWGESDGGTNSPGDWLRTTSLPGTVSAGPLDVTLDSLVPGRTYYYRFRAENSYGVAWGNGPEPFTTSSNFVPTDLTGLELWLKADAGVATNAAGEVQTWQDQSGNSRDASPFKGTPLWAVRDGRPSVGFNGTRMAFATAQAITVFAVDRVNDYVNADGFLGVNSADQGIRLASETQWQAGGLNNFAGLGDGSRVMVNGVATRDFPAGGWHILEEYRQSGAWPFNALGGYYPHPADVRDFHGDVGEVIIYSRALSTTERNQVGWALSQKYAIPSEYYNPQQPHIVTLPASDLDTQAATFNAMLDQFPAERPLVIVYFQAGADGGTGPWTNAVTLPERYPAGAVSHRQGGLRSGTTYYYRFAVSNSAGYYLSTASQSFTTPALMHKWTFNDGTARDSIGTAHGTLLGNAAITAGSLVLQGSSGSNRMQTAVLGHGLGFDKTLVAWCKLADHTDRSPGGGPLAVQSADAAVFDSIVYGERTPGQWMNGSDGYSRTPIDNYGLQETQSGSEILMIVTYDASAAVRVKLYRNGTLYAQHNTVAAAQAYDAAATVRIGPRAGTAGYFNGSVDEARLYSGALGPTAIRDLFQKGPEHAGLILMVY